MIPVAGGGERRGASLALLKALIALLLTGALFSGAAVASVRRRTASRFLQLFGAGALVVVASTHVCEALHWFAGMGWGAADSPGHYLDLASAVLGLVSFATGCLLEARAANRRRRKEA